VIRAAEVLASAEAAWPLARGNPSAYAGALSRAWVWLALCAAFLLPFARRPARLVQLDLAVLVLGLSASYAAWARGNLGLSVPLVYPVLAYLLARLLWIAFRRAPERGPLVLGTGALQLGLLFLLAFRVTLNVVDGIVVDIGRASVTGANHLLAGEPVYGGAFPALIPHGDTYGPVTYVVYAPFAALLGDDAAAHIAAIAFDLACAGGLYLAGGPLAGYLWAACPFTALALNASTNDALIGALVLGAWLCGARRPAARGALTALAGFAKLAPLALLPLLARTRRAALGAAATAAAIVLLLALGPGLPRVWERTVAFQLDRTSPFSLWGAHPGLDWLQTLVTLGAAGLALAVAFVPRRCDARIVAALGAAVLVALQLAAEHWFYYYVVWWAPLALLALIGPRDAAPARSPSPSRPARSGSPQR
jgi:hypothetical protein